MRVVLGEPGGQATVEVAHAVGRLRIERGDGRVERVERRARLRRERLERVARGDDQLEAAADDVVEPALATGAGHQALDAEGPRQRIRVGGVEQARR